MMCSVMFIPGVNTGILPVSYTHLDVYKRQALAWFLATVGCFTFLAAGAFAGAFLAAGLAAIFLVAIVLIFSKVYSKGKAVYVNADSFRFFYKF